MIYLNGELIKRDFFPAGELKLKRDVLLNSGENVFELKWTDEKDLVHLYLLKHHVDSISAHMHIPSFLIISYLPHARMDRENDHFAVTLEGICHMINAMKFGRIAVHDAHSEVATKLLNYSSTYHYSNAMFSALKEKIGDVDYLCFPDAGARIKYVGVIGTHHIQHIKASIFYDKVRDFKTGKITGHKLHKDSCVPDKDSVVVIIDDICSYGTTFMNVAKDLLKRGVREVHLIVSHLEYNITNNTNLFYSDKLLKTISTTNSIFKNNLPILSGTDRIIVHNYFREE